MSDTRWRPLESPQAVFLGPEQAAPQAEQVWLFEADAGKPLELASNCPYELWLDGRFAGDGGHRSIPGEVLADRFPEAASAQRAQVRLHAMDSERSRVRHRIPYPDPFLADLSGGQWTLKAEALAFGAKASGYLPRQNILGGQAAAARPRPAARASLARPWRIIASPISRPRFVPLCLRRVDERLLPAQRPGPFDAQPGSDLARWARDARPVDLVCQTWDLGAIAHHRFEVETDGSACLLVYGEVPEFERTWEGKRDRAHLADFLRAGVPQRLAPFGLRGARYVHLLAEASAQLSVHAWRREYPFSFVHEPVPEALREVVRAARQTLVAVVDGGIVDTCWRERVQWTGDTRMCAMAMRSLTRDRAPIDLALHQIAASYDPAVGMVRGAWPVPEPGVFMPGYHLAFCLAALEHRSSGDPLVRRAVEDSVACWRRRYARSGLVSGIPGWYFIDWDRQDPAATGSGLDPQRPHAVVNAWWLELLGLRGEPQRTQVFDAAFFTGEGYSLVAGDRRPHLHATAAALASGAGAQQEAALAYLEVQLGERDLTRRITPYFAYFVAKALLGRSRARALEFIESFYGPISKRWGTLYEIDGQGDSLAPAWSIAVVALFH